MKTFLRYAWPVLALVILQCVILIVTDSRSLLLGAIRIAAFVLVDFAMGWGQWYSYRQRKALHAEMESIREGTKKRLGL